MIEQKEIPYHRPFPLSDKEIREILEIKEECLRNGQLTNGEYCRRLEDQIKRMYKVDHCVATANCTLGLMACYSYFDGYSILMPGFTWISPYLITRGAHEIKFVDINRDTWLMEQVRYSYGKEILSPNGTFGSVYDVDSNRIIINDFAHCLGTPINNIGKAGVFSLAPTKLVTAGDGGLVIMNDRFLAGHVENFRTKCCRMTEDQAITALATLKHLNEVLKWKAACRTYYERTIPAEFQRIPFASNHNTIGFTSSLKMPDWFDFRRYYEPIADLNHLRNTKRVYETITCLPSYYGAPIERIADSILELNDRKITKEGL